MPKDEDYNWSRYFDAVAGLVPRQTLLFALHRTEQERAADQRLDAIRSRPIAVDLGCGEGRDTLELLRRGWRVIAIDSSQDAINRVLSKCEVEQVVNLEARVQRFEDAMLPQVDLVNASFSLPHCDPGDFGVLWHSVTMAVKPGGRFSGQFFGVRDEWATKPDGQIRTYHSRGDVEKLLKDAKLVPEMLDEIERPGKNAFGERKHWHVFHVVARRV